MYISIYAAGPEVAAPSLSPPDGTCSLAAAGSHRPLQLCVLRLRAVVMTAYCAAVSTATAGPTLCAAFVGTLNSMVCPQSYSQVTTEAACKSLAAIGGKSYGGNVTVATLPPGCFWLNVGGGVYLNTHASGAAHANAQQLCAGAPPSHAQPRTPDAQSMEYP
jgi:hypothetical protein